MKRRKIKTEDIVENPGLLYLYRVLNQLCTVAFGFFCLTGIVVIIQEWRGVPETGSPFVVALAAMIILSAMGLTTKALLRWRLEARLAQSVIGRAYRSLPHKKRQDVLSSSVIGLVVLQRNGQADAGSLALLSAFACEIALSKLFDFPASLLLLTLFIALIAFLRISDLIINHRVTGGDYGTSEDEAREILHFILEHSNKSDLFRGGKLKDLYPALRDAAEKSVPEGTEQTEGAAI
jgi:hypothetical protein